MLIDSTVKLTSAAQDRSLNAGHPGLDVPRDVSSTTMASSRPGL
jgi:hypothetical protein